MKQIRARTDIKVDFQTRYPCKISSRKEGKNSVTSSSGRGGCEGEIHLKITVILIILFLISFIPFSSITRAQNFDIYSQLNQSIWNQNTIPGLSSFQTYNYNAYPSQFSGLFNNLYNSSFSFNNRLSGTIYTPQTASWLNHPPVLTYGPELPMVFNAGETGMGAFFVTDPDFEYFYASSSIGAMGRYTDGTPIWSFSTNFPGWYSVDTTFYDPRGGFVSARSPVYVKPWWSF